MNHLHKNLFTLKDSFPWVIVTSIDLLCLGLLINYGIVDPTGFLVILSVLLAILVAVVARYVIRDTYLEEWNEAYQCDAGCAVINRGKFKDVDYSSINFAITDAAKFWIDWARTRDDTPAWVGAEGAMLRLENSLEYKSIFLVKGPIEVYNPYFMGKAAGLIDVGGNPVISGNTKVSEYDPQNVLSLVIHECSHVFLSALGFDPGPVGEKHHKIFAETGYC